MTDAAAAAAVAALLNNYSLIKGRHAHSVAAAETHSPTSGRNSGCDVTLSRL